MKRISCLGLLTLLIATHAPAADTDPTRILPDGQKPADHRVGRIRQLNETDFFFQVPATLPEWKARRQALREQVLVANGLWPLPEKTALHAVIHGKIDRDDYTIEKVFFASYPGHYVSGNLYRPKGKKGKVPGVLCPHGHWNNGRLYDAGEKAGQAQIDKKAEKTMEGARYPLQARCAQLARMGCVVFHYDMVGYADSTAIDHRKGFNDALAELRLQSFMGLQTWNSIRALDFLLSLPEVDAKRIGVTGASGGGTQTFLLGAVDDRPTVAFPAVMVSTEMQGGCICENCSYLRQHTGNIELAGLFAPKPLAMSGAHDWTLHIEERGLPELKKLYALYGVEDKVLARCFPQFEHNYNQVSREVMYNWFNKYLGLGHSEPIAEKPFKPVLPAELRVYTDDHPRPSDSVGAERLREYMSETSDKQIRALLPTNEKTLAAFRRVVRPALRVMIQDELPGKGAVETKKVAAAGGGAAEDKVRPTVIWERFLLGRKGQGEQIPTVLVRGPKFDGTVVVWIHPEGKSSLVKDGTLTAEARKVLDSGAALLAADVYGTGELVVPKLPAKAFQNAGFTYAGYYYGYNRPLLAQRVHDILTTVAFARDRDGVKKVHLVGFEQAGPWVLLARGLCGDAVTRTGADFNGFRFEKVRTIDDDMMLPGALKYGGLPALAALAAPGELFMHNHRGTGAGQWIKAAYEAAGAGAKLQRSGDAVAPEKVIAWLLR